MILFIILLSVTAYFTIFNKHIEIDAINHDLMITVLPNDTYSIMW